MLLRKLYEAFRGDIVAIPWRLISLFFLVLLSLIPLVTQEPYILRLMTMCAMYAIFAASWDFLSGFTGQLSLGHALFFGLSAYTAALLNKHFHLSALATIPVGIIVSLIGGLIACLPALRLRGFYLALVTLALPIILRGVLDAFPDFTGGEVGIYGLSGLTGSAITDYYIIFSIMVLSLLIMWKLTDTKSKLVRTGLIFRAVREDEITARASGINTTFYKILAFAISGFFAGVAGGIYAHYLRVVGPSTLDVTNSFNPVIWTIFGGVGTIYGPVAGAYVLYSLIDLMRLNPLTEQMRLIIQPFFLALVLLFMPEGMIPWIREHIEEDCPRCKLTNIVTRRYCRACGALMHPKKGTE